MSTVFISLALTAVALAGFYIIFRRKLSLSESQRNVLENIESEIRSLIIEMNKTTDRNIELIEDSINDLKTLIEQADKRITVLKKEQKIEIKPVKIRQQDVAINTVKIPKKLSFKNQVLDMHKKGIEAKVIAAKMEANIGEVELILSLSRGNQGE